MCAATARVGLDCSCIQTIYATELRSERRRIRRVRISFEYTAIIELVNLSRPRESKLRELRCEHARMRSLACMQPLAHGAIRIESPDATALGAGKSKRPCRPLG